MFDNTNPYTLYTKIVGGITRYFISFTDGQAIRRKIEVSHAVYLEFMLFIKTERNLRRWDERHLEQSELTEETLYSRALNVPKSVEDTTFDIFRDNQLRQAIQNLPEIQRRRFILYHEFELTYEQIADMEGCTFQAIAKSVKSAETRIKKFFKNKG